MLATRAVPEMTVALSLHTLLCTNAHMHMKALALMLSVHICKCKPVRAQMAQLRMG